VAATGLLSLPFFVAFTPLFVGAALFERMFSAAPQSSQKFLHDPSLPLLKAALHSDPNPVKGGGDITIVGGVALLSDSGPSGTLADIAEHPPHGEISTYVVRPGDTLSGIAQMFDVSVNTILWANGLSSRTIRIGQELIILPVSGVKYTVKKGDTLSSIAKAYKGDAEEIALFNNLHVGDSLAVGSSIIIPGGEVTAPKTSPTYTTPVKSTGTLVDASGYYTYPAPGTILTQGIHGYNAIDLGGRTGTPVLAAASGRVIIARSSGWNGGYGNYVVISHGNGTQTLYAHLSSLSVSSGDTVSQGQTIGAIGATGRSTGPHLHFEIRGAKNPFTR
jgi:murein DD-endopeptidase MepM/ murein hydrolase activator NlpD